MTSDKIWDPRQFDIEIDVNTTTLPSLRDRRPDGYDLQGEYIGAVHDIKDDDDEASLEDFVSGELFEDAESKLRDKPQDTHFWVNSIDYDHSETVNRCMRSAYNYERITAQVPRSHNASEQDYDKLKQFFA